MSKWEKDGKDPTKRPTMLSFGHRVDCIEYYQQEIDELDGKIKAEKTRILHASSTVGGVNTSAGFVTFYSRSDAEVALHLNYTSDSEEWVVSIPPGPDSVRWSDLQDDPNK